MPHALFACAVFSRHVIDARHQTYPRREERPFRRLLRDAHHAQRFERCCHAAADAQNATMETEDVAPLATRVISAVCARRDIPPRRCAQKNAYARYREIC